jgi:hypothetical protein
MKLSDSHAPYGTPHKPGIPLDLVSDVGSVIGLPPAFIVAAMRTVAGRAADATDARDLLERLGLIDPHTPSPTWRRNNTPKAAS